MCAKLSKISITLSEELRKSIDILCKQFSLSRSRLIETYLREHPNVEKCVVKRRSQMQATVVQITCSLCGDKLGEDEIKIDTPRYGILCTKCWAKKMGKFIEENPISDT
jgi:hypothetical protein